MTASQLLKLNKILDEKNWKSDLLFEFVEKKIQTLLTFLKEEEINLLLELLNDFTWISHNSYQKLILDVFRKIDAGFISRVSKFYFFPIVKPTDVNKIKSGPALIYPITGFLNHLTEFDHIDKEIVSNYKALKKIRLQPNEFLVLIDDFIGSGKTLSCCIEKLNELGFDHDSLIICSLAIQQEGLNLINDWGIKVYYSHIEKKGITDKFAGDEQAEKLERMIKMELKLKFDKKFSLGFEKSEGLISMIRTPNNTFPIFWHEYKNESSIQKAPFPRF